MHYPIKSLLYLVGDDEFADSPARVNIALFADHCADWKDLGMDVKEFEFIEKIEINPHAQPARMGTRMLVAIRFTRPDGTAFIQPFYRSSGRATPELSKAGEWWPCSGLYTAAYCVWRKIDIAYEGHIGKHQRLFGRPGGVAKATDYWVNHGKDRKLVHPQYQMVCDYLVEVIK